MKPQRDRFSCVRLSNLNVKFNVKLGLRSFSLWNAWLFILHVATCSAQSEMLAASIMQHQSSTLSIPCQAARQTRQTWWKGPGDFVHTQTGHAAALIYVDLQYKHGLFSGVKARHLSLWGMWANPLTSSRRPMQWSTLHTQVRGLYNGRPDLIALQMPPSNQGASLVYVFYDDQGRGMKVKFRPFKRENPKKFELSLPSMFRTGMQIEPCAILQSSTSSTLCAKRPPVFVMSEFYITYSICDMEKQL